MRYHFLLVFTLSTVVMNLHAQATNRRGQDIALFFAVEHYESDKLIDLPNAVKNANDIAKVLREDYGFKTEVIIDPTLDEIDLKLKEYDKKFQNQTLSRKGQLFLYFSGHGIQENKSGYFLPADAALDRLPRTGMAYNIWRPIISQMSCQHILVAIDACYSVTFDLNWKSKGHPKFKRRKEYTEDQYVLSDFNTYPARLFYTSDAKEDVVPDRSNFARKLLEGLRTERGKAAFMTSQELFANHIYKATPSPKFGYFEDDDPQSNFLFFSQASISHTYYQRQQDLNAYAIIKNKPTVEGCQNYLHKFPSGQFQQEVKKCLEALLDQQEWEFAELKDKKSAYQKYLNKYPQGRYAEAARQRIISTLPSSITPKSPQSMVYIKGGTFEMGDPFGEGVKNEKPNHKVTISSFYLSRKELTVGEYMVFLEATQQGYKEGIDWQKEKHAVVNVDWYDAITYCNWRSNQEGLEVVYDIQKQRPSIHNKNQYDKKKWAVNINPGANGYRLPTEAEWEFAARSRGKQQKWAGTSSLAALFSYANYIGKQDGYPAVAPVASFQANDLGIYDMSGNVWEWCWDWYAPYPSTATNNPTGPDMGAYRVLRGGSYKDGANFLRSSYRGHSDPDYGNLNGGFRIARSAG